MTILSGSKFDFRATHFCGSSVYRVTKHNQHYVEKHLPDNLFEMSREELVPVVKSIMETMNILWSSSGGVPSFPEKFGEHTGLSSRNNRMYICGRGWSVEIFNGRHDDIQPAYANRISELINDKIMTEDEKIKAIDEFCGPMASPIG